jgi:CubicO group peptidase (beta-lactamase class C family)
MKNQYLSYFLLPLVMALCSSCASIPAPPEKIESISEFENYVNKVVESGAPPGMSFAVIRNDSIIYCKGFGWADEPRNIQATSNTVYHWWSCTKIATAIAILQLQEQGKLSLGDPVIRYLPFFRVEYPADTSREITIFNLLNHTSGLQDPSGVTLLGWIHHDGEPSVNQTELIKRVLPEYSRLGFEPGDHAEYANLGYMVLGAIIEKITGMTYEDYVRDNILLPLGMTRSDFLYTESMKPDEAAGAHRTFHLWTPMLFCIAGSYVREIDWNHLWMERVYTDQTPSTALIGSVTDAARLVAAYLNGGVLNGHRILSQQSIAQMTYEGQIRAEHEDSLDYRRQGLCWQIFGKSGRWVITHDGGGPGFSTKIQLYPDEHLGFVLFTNDATSENWKIINLAATLKW